MLLQGTVIRYAVKYSETELIFSYGLLYLCSISNHLMNRKGSYAKATHITFLLQNETLINMSWCWNGRVRYGNRIKSGIYRRPSRTVPPLWGISITVSYLCRLPSQFLICVGSPSLFLTCVRPPSLFFTCGGSLSLFLTCGGSPSLLPTNGGPSTRLLTNGRSPSVFTCGGYPSLFLACEGSPKLLLSVENPRHWWRNINCVRSPSLFLTCEGSPLLLRRESPSAVSRLWSIPCIVL